MTVFCTSKSTIIFITVILLNCSSIHTGTKKVFEDLVRSLSVCSMSRTVVKVVVSRWQDEGVGARVRRSVGRPEVCKLDKLENFNMFLRGGGGWVKEWGVDFNTLQQLYKGFKGWYYILNVIYSF